MTTYNIIVIDECGHEQTYWGGFPTKALAQQEIAGLMTDHPEWYNAWVEPNLIDIYKQEYLDREANDTLDMY